MLKTILKKKKKTDRIVAQMVKANPKSTVSPKVHRLNFGMICCLFRYSTYAGYIKLIAEI